MKWVNFIQQKLMEPIEDFLALLDNGVVDIATVVFFTVIQLAFVAFLSVTVWMSVTG